MDWKKITISILAVIVAGYLMAFAYNIYKAMKYSKEYELESSKDIDAFKRESALFAQMLDVRGDILGFKYSRLKKGEISATYRLQDTNVYLLQLPITVDHVSLSEGMPDKRKGHYMSVFEIPGCKTLYRLDENELTDQKEWNIYTDGPYEKVQNSYMLEKPSFINMVDEQGESRLYIECKDKDSRPIKLTVYNEKGSLIIKLDQVI